MLKPRLSRLQWIYTRNPVYFVTACTHARRRLLDNRPAHTAFVNFCQGAHARGVWVGRYVFMPDHLHLFVGFAAEATTLSDWVKGLKRSLAEVWKASQIAGPYWQKGFFDHLLRSEESYSQKWTYVRENPVRAGLVGNAGQWPYQGEIHPLAL